MSNEEALEIITNAIQKEGMTVEQDSALAIVQKAVYKQIPRAVDMQNEKLLCPNCGKIFGYLRSFLTLSHWDMPHCKYCGQALKWH